MTKSYRNVCELAVPNDLCIGCGVCAGICPARVLTMRFNEFGAYIPVEEKEGCLPKCDLCLRACPFTDQEDNEDTLAQAAFGQTPEIQHTPELGYYLDTYVGYSQVDSHRENGASGGLATWFLETLLTQGIVDKVICVTPNSGNPRKLFQFAVLDSVEAVRNASRSCYYPVEMSVVIHEVLREEGRYVITGLPCFLKALRLAMRKNARLRRRLVALVGLVCGQMKSKFFVEYLVTSLGGIPDQVSRCQFRVKSPNRPAWDLGTQLEWRDRDRIKNNSITWATGFSEPWTHNYFKLNACNFCDDVFAETADIVFMDAWLPEYNQDPKGHNLVLVRTNWIRDIFQNGQQSGEVFLEKIQAKRVIRSQKTVLEDKREGMQFFTWLAKKEGLPFPKKRWEPRRAGGFISRMKRQLKRQMAQTTREQWTQKKDFKKLRRSLWWVEFQMSILDQLGRLWSILKHRK